MEFDAEVSGEQYHITSLNGQSFLVSSPKEEYIVYKKNGWRCADEINPALLERLGEAIDRTRTPFT